MEADTAVNHETSAAGSIGVDSTGRSARFQEALAPHPTCRKARVGLFYARPEEATMRVEPAVKRTVAFVDGQDLFHAALRELRQLVDEGYLVLEGERRGARYLAGPKLGL